MLTDKRGIYYQLVLSQQKTDKSDVSENNAIDDPVYDDEPAIPKSNIYLQSISFQWCDVSLSFNQ